MQIQNGPTSPQKIIIDERLTSDKTTITYAISKIMFLIADPVVLSNLKFISAAKHFIYTI